MSDMLDNVAPERLVVTEYDRRHLYTYAELIGADDAGVDWDRGAQDILGRDPVAEPQTTKICWETHLARARWITGAGLALAIEAFGRADLPFS